MCKDELEQYLINKAWEWRRIGEFQDLETAKLVIRGKQGRGQLKYFKAKDCFKKQK